MAELQLILRNNTVKYNQSFFFLTIRAFSKHIPCKHDPGHSNLLMTLTINSF